MVEVYGSASNTGEKIQRVTRYGVSGHSSWRPLGGTSLGWLDWVENITNADLKIKYGFVTVAAKQNETVSFNVTFDEAFKVLPAVVSTVTTTQPSENHTSINNVTVNGFTGLLYRAGASGNINVRWIAVGK